MEDYIIALKELRDRIDESITLAEEARDKIESILENELINEARRLIVNPN